MYLQLYVRLLTFQSHVAVIASLITTYGTTLDNINHAVIIACNDSKDYL